jgi:hypothetical protein
MHLVEPAQPARQAGSDGWRIGVEVLIVERMHFDMRGITLFSTRIVNGLSAGFCSDFGTF